MGQVDDAGRGRHAAAPEPTAGPATEPAPGLAAVPGRHRAGGSLGRFRAVLRRPVTLAIVAIALVLVVIAAVTTSTPDDDPGSATDAGSGDGLLSWASAQLPVGATLEADPTLAAELGLSRAETDELTTGAPPGSGAEGPVLQVVRGADPGGLTVVARFTDAAGGELTVVDPAAVPPDAAQLDRRRRLGAALLANPMTAAPAAAAQRLRDGEVDPRLLTLLAGMAARFGVQLADLPVATGEEAGAPARAALVSAVDGRPVAEGTAELAELRGYLAAQLDVFSPDEVQLVEGGLLVRFRYITDPDGAVTRGGG